MTTRVTILGCGSSGGVPRLGNDWGACDPENPKNRRRRCSILITRKGAKGLTRVLIDTSPDMREQLLSAEVDHLDGVVYTHDHADHLHGIDDLRMLVIRNRARVKVWSDAVTKTGLFHRFAYVFVQPEGSSYPPILDHHLIDGPVTIDGAGGEITLTPIPVTHGNIGALGFRIGDLAYIPDVSEIPETSWPLLAGLKTWVLDTLRYTPHPSHANLETSLNWIARAAPESAVLTNLHTDLDYETLAAETPNHITPAYDGMVIPA